MSLLEFALTDHILLPDFLYFLRYWSICVLQLFVNQVVTKIHAKNFYIYGEGEELLR